MNRNRHMVRLVVLTATLSATVGASAQIDFQQKIQAAGQATRASAMVRSSSGGSVPEDLELVKIAPGFLLNINVLDDADFSGSYRVDEHGEIFVPYLGKLKVTGGTASETRELFRQKLIALQVLKDPQVELSIAEYVPTQITISGEVVAPGKYPLLAPHSLLDVLTMANGTTIYASGQIYIRPADPARSPVEVHYSPSADPIEAQKVLINPGDVLQVKKAGIVYILGAVSKPGGYLIQDEGNITLLQLINAATGTTQTASLHAPMLLRKDSNGFVTRIKLPYGRILKGMDADYVLKPNDVVVFGKSWGKMLASNSSYLVNSLATAAIYRLLYR